VERCFNEAAALRRGKLAEILRRAALGDPASMRPRLFAAENLSREGAIAARAQRFNEAAALRRGKRMIARAASARPTASMRPRLFAAENG